MIDNGADDQWGRDPGVGHLRVVFGAVEEASGSLLSAWGIDEFDPGLLQGRRRALGLFERAWDLAARQGRVVGPQEAAWIYGRCLQSALEIDEATHGEAPAGLVGPDWVAELVEQAAR